MDTPLYNELVSKYYLAKGIKPFSFPHEPVGVNAVPKLTIKVSDIRNHLGPKAHVSDYIDLVMGRYIGRNVAEANLAAADEVVKKYEYFRL